MSSVHPHGVFLRREALARGVDDRDLRSAVRRGEFAHVRHGAYVAGARWRESDDVARHVLRAHAVALSHQTPFALGGVTAAAVHGMRLWNVPLDRIHVDRPVDTRGHALRDVKYHLRHVGTATVIAGSPVARPASAAVEAAMLVGVEEGVVLVDSAYDLGLCSPEEVREEYIARRRWPGTGRLRVTLPLAEVGSQSVGESRMRFLFWTLGLPKPVLQFPIVRDGRVVAYTDFAWPHHEVLGEFDGKVKYDQHLRGGESPADALFREKRREDMIREVTGWRVVRFTWSDLSSRGEVRERMWRLLRRSA